MRPPKITYYSWRFHSGIDHDERMAKVRAQGGTHHDYWAELIELGDDPDERDLRGVPRTEGR